MESARLINLTEIEGRGRALIAAEPLKAGQIILRDSPILLYSALPFSTTNSPVYCSNCFRIVEQNPLLISCPSCSLESSTLFFCSPNCCSIALASSHTPWVCQALRRLRDPLLHHHNQNHDLHVQARFLVAAYNLSVVSPPDFTTLLSLQGEMCHSDYDSAHFLHSLISSFCPPASPPLSAGGFGFSVELTAALLAKDKLNAFGLMEPFSEDRSIRNVRAYGIYPKASFFNHDCLPNACRFEYIDASPAEEKSVIYNNTNMVIRMIHDVPQGREICLSYFPVNLKYSERQRRLREDYGFTCECDRCKVEANWSDSEEENEAMEEEEEEEMVEEKGCNGDEHMVEEDLEGETDTNNDFPHAYFFLSYMCNRNNCHGTLAPLPPSGESGAPNVMECNVCGNLTKKI